MISTPLMPNAILQSLEDRYHPIIVDELSKLQAEYHIIILGRVHALDDSSPANTLLSQKALERLSEGIRLHRKLPNSILILSGFSASGRTTQAEMLQKIALLSILHWFINLHGFLKVFLLEMVQ